MMNNQTSDPIGAAWLIRHASIDLVSPLYVSSSIGGRRQTYKEGDVIHNAYQETARPLDTIIAHQSPYSTGMALYGPDASCSVLIRTDCACY